MEYIKELKTVKVSDIESNLSQYSRNTLKKDLAFLVKEGLLIKTGEKKGTQYHYKEQK